MTQETNKVYMEIPAKSEYVSVVRLAISGLATRLNFSIEEIEDMKIAISEACTNAVQHAYEDQDGGTIQIDSTIHQDRIEIVVKDTGTGFDLNILGTPEQKENSEKKLGLGLGLTFIKNLMDEVEVTSDVHSGTTIRMVKLLPKTDVA